RRRSERGDELQRYVSLEHARQASLVETRRSAREAEQRLSSLERDERGLNDRIAALERARREAEARGAATAAATITTADLGQLDWPVDGKILYQFGTAAGPNNTRIPWHGIGIAAPAGTAVRAVHAGRVSLAGPIGSSLRQREQVLGAQRLAVRECDHAGGHGRHLARAEFGERVAVHDLAQAIHEAAAAFAIRLGQDERELVTAVARYEVGRADLALHHRPELREHAIPRGLPEPLVDLPQPVDIEQHEREAQ